MITNQIALKFWNNEANVAKTLPVNQNSGTFSGRDLGKLGFGITPTLALVLDFSLKNTLYNMVLFVKIPVIRVIRPVRKAFVAKM